MVKPPLLAIHLKMVPFFDEGPQHSSWIYAPTVQQTWSQAGCPCRPCRCRSLSQNCGEIYVNSQCWHIYFIYIYIHIYMYIYICMYIYMLSHFSVNFLQSAMALHRTSDGTSCHTAKRSSDLQIHPASCDATGLPQAHSAAMAVFFTMLDLSFLGEDLAGIQQNQQNKRRKV